MRQIKELALDLLHFNWGVPDSGYIWDPGAKPDKHLGTRGQPPFLLVHPKTKLENRYCPLPFDEPLPEDSIPLFQQFADLDPTQEVIKQFADKHGWLGIAEPVISAHYPGIVAMGESYRQWRKEIIDLRMAVSLWKSITDENEEAFMQSVRWLPGDSPRTVVISRESRTNVLHERTNPDLFRVFTPGDLIGPARAVLQLDVNKKLQGAVSPCLLFTRKRALGGFFRPHNLLAALWLQLYQAILGQRRIRVCQYCKDWVDVTDRRVDKVAHDKCVHNAKVSRCRWRKELKEIEKQLSLKQYTSEQRQQLSTQQQRLLSKLKAISR